MDSWQPFALALLGLAIGLALLVPRLQTSRTGGSESAAIGALKAIGNAQTLYREGDKDGNGTLEFAPALTCLVNTGEHRDEDLVDEILAGGTKQGYVFAITSASEFGWTATASPAIPGTTGDRYFGASMAGRIFFSHTGPVTFRPDGSSPDRELGK